MLLLTARRTLLVLTALAATVVAAGVQPAQAKAPWQVTVTVSRSSLDLGSTAVLRGSVSPSAQGTTVTVQRKYVGGTWATIGTATVRSTSTYSFTVKPTRAGTSTYRVVKRSSGGRAQDVSSTVSLTTYRWRWLTDLVWHEGYPGSVSEGEVIVNAARYPQALTLDHGATVYWDMFQYRCNAVRGLLAGETSTSTQDGTLWVRQSNDTLGAEFSSLAYHSPLRATNDPFWTPQRSIDQPYLFVWFFTATASTSQGVVAQGQVHCAT